jgi:single-stranded-DNA-specific exonuclease
VETEWVEDRVDEEARHALTAELGLDPFLALLLVRRGLAAPQEARAFLQAPLSDLPRPHGMKDLAAGVDLVWEHVGSGRKIAVYGDYDVDGITSAAIVTCHLGALGAGTETFLASRFEYGYGMGPKQAGAIVESGATLALLVDCGTSDFEAAEFLEARGVRTVVIDHHRLGSRPPPVSAFVNPMQPDCAFPDKALTAAGLSFYFTAMMNRRRPAGKGPADLPDPRDYLDLAAVGTVADVASVRGANRCILRSGLRRLSGSPRPSLARLVAAAGITRRRRGEEVVSFHISPVLNAAGRMGDPALALRFLLAGSDGEAAELHEKIALVNEKRKEAERAVAEAARFQMSRKDPSGRASLVLAGRGWHPGVLGIVANRLAERTGIVVAVIGVDGKTGRGSIRAPSGMNVFSALEPHRDLFERMGGHSAAVGFSISEARIGELEEALEEACRRQGRRRELRIDAALSVDEADWFHVEEIEKLAPFGTENPLPLIRLEGAAVEGGRIVGQDHLKFQAVGRSRAIPVFGPHLGRYLGRLRGDMSLLGHLRADTYRGGRNVEFVLKDFR